MVSDSEVRSRGKHRTFTADQKARILAEYESASTALERAALMRREGVYSSLLSN
jgi:transposase